MARTRTDSETGRARKRLTPEAVTTWLFVILCSVFLANAAVLLTAPSQDPVLSGPPESRWDQDQAVRAEAAATGGSMGLGLATLGVLLVLLVRHDRSPRMWWRLLHFLAAVWGICGLGLLAKFSQANGLPPSPLWSVFEYLIPTAALFFVMWIQVWIAVRNQVWLKDPAQVESVFE